MKKYIQHLGADASSSIVVFLVAIPLCLGIAVASGVNEFSGILAGIVGGIVIGILSGSHLSVSGPAAGLTAIVSMAVLKLPALEAFFLAVVLAGVLQVLMGIFKAGIIGDYVPNSVIKGMLAAIGIILILKQASYLVGYQKTYEGDQAFIQVSGENTFSSLVNSLNHITPLAAIIGIIGLVILIAYETKWMKSIPIFKIISGPLVVVLVGVAFQLFFAGSNPSFALDAVHLVDIPVASNPSEFIGFLTHPDFSFVGNYDVWLTAVTLALVASLETLLSIEAIDKLDTFKRVTPPNRELIAQGTGNIVSGLLGGLPVTSVIVRSSANQQSGARTKMSAIFHGLLILVFVLFAPQWLNLIPKAALAAILIFTGYKLARISLFKEYYRQGWSQFAPFVITILAILFTDLLKGIIVGIAVGIFFIIRSNFRSAIFVLKENSHVLIRMRKDISFFSKPILKRHLERIKENSSVVIDMTRAEFIDKDVLDVINEYMQHAHLKNITVEVQKSTYNTSKNLDTPTAVADLESDMAH